MSMLFFDRDIRSFFSTQRLTGFYALQTWSFLWYDGPDYHIGNGLNLATSSTVLIVTILTLLWMKRDNKKRAQRNVEEELTGLTDKEIEDLDWKHPAFKWRP